MPKRTAISKILSICKLTFGGGLVYTGLSIHNNNKTFYENIMPMISYVDPEFSHKLAVNMLKYNLISKQKTIDSPVLETRLLDWNLTNPIGVAAGFDKQGEAIVGLKNAGFGYVEIGTITPEPQPGNPKPRVFRLPEDEAVINRFGFNSDGHQRVLQRLNELPTEILTDTVLGVNLGKNKTSDDAIGDYTKGIEVFGAKADYLVINVSSPNTPGLRNLQSKDNLQNLLESVVSKRNSLNCDKRPLLLLKLSPDLSKDEKRDISIILNQPKCKIDGLIISNTTIQRLNLQNKKYSEEVGGLSGKPLKDMSTTFIREMYELTKGKIPIIGVGGIKNGEDAFEKILAGATALQIYTAFIYNGPPVISQIKSELAECLISSGYKNVNEAVGKGIKK